VHTQEFIRNLSTVLARALKKVRQPCPISSVVWEAEINILKSNYVLSEDWELYGKEPLCPRPRDGRMIVFLSVNQLSAILTPAYRCFAYGVIKKKKKFARARRTERRNSRMKKRKCYTNIAEADIALVPVYVQRKQPWLIVKVEPELYLWLVT
jgi:hypothetical protein